MIRILFSNNTLLATIGSKDDFFSAYYIEEERFGCCWDFELQNLKYLDHHWLLKLENHNIQLSKKKCILLYRFLFSGLDR